jgi:TrmH family RNA methyltransferase
MISSEKNRRIQMLRSLIDQAKERKKSSLFVVEGVRLLEEALSAAWEIEQVLYSEVLSPRGMQLIEACKAKQIPVEEVSVSIMEKIADTVTPQGIMGVIALPVQKVPQVLDFVLICDAIRDPGNLGTMIRTAAAAGVQAIFLAPGTSDAFSPKVIRSGMGAHFFVPILKLTWPEIAQVCHNRPAPLRILGSRAGVAENCWQIDLTGPSAIIVGSESEGISAEAAQIVDTFVSIPMPGMAESLNAAIAASILLFETVRQRTT